MEDGHFFRECKFSVCCIGVHPNRVRCARRSKYMTCDTHEVQLGYIQENLKLSQSEAWEDLNEEAAERVSEMFHLVLKTEMIVRSKTNN